jgi:hypothetical protein
LLKYSVSLAERAARLLCRISESGSTISSKKWPLLNFSPGEPIYEDSNVDAQEHSEHSFVGGHRMHNSCRNLIGRYTPYLLMILVLQKPWLLTSHDIMEGDSLLSFKRPE